MIQPPPVTSQPQGDRGQRYELWGRLHGRQIRLGWTGANNLERFRESLKRDVSALTVVRVIDRQENSITCSTCNKCSYSPADIANHYCGSCRTFLTDPAPGEPGSAHIAKTEEDGEV